MSIYISTIPVGTQAEGQNDGTGTVYMSSSCPICLEDFPPISDIHPPQNDDIGSRTGIEMIGLDHDQHSSNLSSSSSAAASSSNNINTTNSTTVAATVSSNQHPNRPMSMQCGHVCCHQCLINLFSTAGRSRLQPLCPICRAPCEDTNTGATGSHLGLHPNDDVRDTRVEDHTPLLPRLSAFTPPRSAYTYTTFRRMDRLDRRMEYIYRAQRISELYPRAMDPSILNRVLVAIDSGDLNSASTLLNQRHTINASTITSIATRAAAKSSGSSGSSSKKSSFGGGRSSGGRGGGW